MTSNPRARTLDRVILAWVVLGITAWLALVALIGGMYLARTPPSAGFDLELLLVGGRRVAAGVTPYDAALIAGQSVEIQSLFYSYPPLVAQAMSVLAGVPSWLVLIVWALGASVAAVAVAGLLERRMTGRLTAGLVVPTAALLPLWFPFTVALLFGNLDAWFAALFGLLLIGALAAARFRDGAPTLRRDLVLAGLALAVVSVTKLHPASLGLWFLIRGARERADGATGLPPSSRILAVAAAAVAVVLVASLAVGGVGPWLDYVAVLRAGTNADLLDFRNLGPAVQIALVAGLDMDGVRLIQPVVTILAVVATAAFAWRVRDAIESLAWASVASFVILPVTWFHYPSALVPFAVGAVIRARSAGRVAYRRTLVLGGGALLLGMVGLGLPLMWLSILLLLAAVRASRAEPDALRTASPDTAAVGA